MRIFHKNFENTLVLDEFQKTHHLFKHAFVVADYEVATNSSRRITAKNSRLDISESFVRKIIVSNNLIKFFNPIKSSFENFIRKETSNYTNRVKVIPR